MKDLPIPLSALWDNCSSLGFHKIDEGPNKLSSPIRVKNGDLLGRHTSIEQDKGRCSVRWHKSERDSGKFGVHDKFQEINIHTCSSNRISRIQNRFYDNENLSTTGKYEKDHKNVSRGLKDRQSICKKTVRGHRNLTGSLQAVHQAPLHYRHLQTAKNEVLKKGQNYDALVFLSRAMKEDLKWWTNHLKESNGKNIIQLIDQKSIIIQTYASKLGWGQFVKI